MKTYRVTGYSRNGEFRLLSIKASSAKEAYQTAKDFGLAKRVKVK